MQVKEVMKESVVTLRPEDTAVTAAQLLARHNVGSLPVRGTDGGLRGILTDRDIVLRCVAIEEDPAKVAVRDIMTRNCATVGPQEDAREAARLMAAHQVRRIPVLEDDKLVGILSLGDLSQSHSCDMETARALCDISDEPHEVD